MGSNDGDAAAASTEVQVIADLQAKLKTAKAAVVALQAAANADARKIPPPAPAATPRSSSSSDEPELLHAAVDDIDAIMIGRLGPYLKDFEIPRRVARPAGFSILFEPSEVEFRATFADNVRDRMEATSLYQVCYWRQEAINEATNAYYHHEDYTPTELEECPGGYVIYLKRIHRIDVKRFDYLETKQTDQLPAREASTFLGRAPLPACGIRVAKHAGRHLGAHDGAQPARALLTAAFTDNTKRTYMAAWDRLATYCHEENLCALPAYYTTVAGYVGRTHARGTVSASSVGTYLSPVDTIHELAGYEPPTAHPIFQRLRKGYPRLSAAGAGAMLEYLGPLAATSFQEILMLGVAKPSPEQRRICAGLVLAILMFNGPGAAAATRAADPHLYAAGAAHSAGVPQERDAHVRALCLPCARAPSRLRLGPAADLPTRVRARLCGSGRVGLGALFARLGQLPGPRVTSRWLCQALTRLGATPPVGVRWSIKSLRSGAATAANAVGVQLPVVAAYMEHAGPAVAARHYIYARLLPSAAAWEFFGRYLSDWSGILGPARKGGYA
ncbi:hypothetical protein I4F81_010510 [Pyropia yezoensis]|uniref:Uncharacterized protein n=1 Tax=Pyropia yezoensis TaxID=2788 RepID=A0ACC3CD54_PYRYE|nr:hypothetical protein I4F81_010510 [Neopyropia yezoensis]